MTHQPWVLKTRSRELSPDTGPKRIGSGRAPILNGFESALLPHPSNLGEAPFPAPSFLGLEGDP